MQKHKWFFRIAGAIAFSSLNLLSQSPLTLTTPSLPPGTVGILYHATVTASGGAGPYQWTVTGLPAGLTFSSNGSSIDVSGTPTAPTTGQMVTVKVADSGGGIASKNYTLTISSPVTITTPSLPQGTVGTMYQATLTATGGFPPYFWSASGLPAGLSIKSNPDGTGTISGIPTTAVQNKTVMVSVSGYGSSFGAGKSLPLTINPGASALTITTPSLPQGAVGTMYQATMRASGGVPPYKWSSSVLPAGLSITTNADGTATIAGTPTTAVQNQTVTVTVTDSANTAVSKAYQLTINPSVAPLTITTPSLPQGAVGSMYQATVTANGGVPPYKWSAAGLPAGLSIATNADGTATIAGAPTTAAQNQSVSVTVTDSANTTTTKSYPLTINPAGSPLTITTQSLPQGTVGVAYQATVTATGGVPAYQWSASSLPAGLSIATNADGTATISGTPATAAQNQTVNVTVTDSVNTTANKSYQLTISPPALNITTSSLPQGIVGTPYQASVAATGGVPPYKWSATGLPAGLSIATNSDGTATISGTPTTAAQNQSVSVSVTDSANTSAGKSYQLTINPSPLTITASSLPQGTVGTPYQASVMGSGGTPPYEWSVTGLPAGLTTAGNGSNTLIVSGVPTVTTSQSVTISLSDAGNGSANKSYSLTIAVSSFTIATQSLPPGNVGLPYKATLTAAGGVLPYRWAAGGLPDGLSIAFNPVDGTATISGTPTTAVQNQPVGVIVLDSTNSGVNTSYLLTISSPAPPVFSDPPSACSACGGCRCGAPSGSVPSPTSSSNSVSEGNLTEQVPVSNIASTLSLSFVYNTFNADGSRAMLDTVMGYGWTHSYNIFLFSQAGIVFRYDGAGRVTRWSIGDGGAFIAAPGYFETLTTTAGAFTITEKDQTKYNFAQIPGTSFQLGGSVYMLTSIVDRNGNTTTLAYKDGNLTTVTDTYGRNFTFAYNAQGRLTSVSDPLGRSTSLRYDSTGRQLTEIADPNGNSIQYTYNNFYQLVTKTDKDGRTFSYTYTNGSPGLPIAVNDSAGTARAALSNSNNWAIDPKETARLLQRTYMPSTTTLADGLGNQWRYSYDSNGYLTQAIAPDAATTQFTYDGDTLQLGSMTDANGNTTKYAYDSMGNRTKMVDAMGNVTAYTYEPVFNMTTSMTDARGRVTKYTYDERGNRIQEIDPLGQARKWTYDSHGNVLTDTDKNGHMTTYRYDAFGNRVKIVDALGNQTATAYDSAGNIVSRTDANSHMTAYQYDGLNRVTKIADAAGNIDQTVYDGQGNRVQSVDRNGHGTAYQYDQRQRVIQMTDAASQNETYLYDGNDNRISLTDRNGHTTSYGYDVQNRRIGVTDALGNTATNSYDPVGNVISRTDANGNTTTSVYDALNRPTSVTDALGEQTRFRYDTGDFTGPVTLGGVTATCTQCGATPGSSLIAAQVDPDGTSSLHAGVTFFKYDALDRPVVVDRKTGCVAGADGTGCPDNVTSNDAVTVYSYDPVGNRPTATEPNGNTTRYDYDADNRRIKETNAAGDVTKWSYDGVGNVITLTAPNLNVTTTTYDSLDRPIQATDSLGPVGSYSYDPVGNRLSETDGNGNATTHTFDSLDRLLTTTDALGNTTTTQYDPVGNLLTTTDRNGNSTNYAYDAINRRSSVTDALGNATQNQYDPVGNLMNLTDANGHVTQYFYDAVNRPIEETYADGLSRSYAYDGAGNLTSRTDQLGQTTIYTYNDLYFLTGRSYPSSVNDTMTYDLSGRLLSAQRASWLDTFSYDGANRIVQSVQNGSTIDYSYDIPGRQRTVTYPGGRATTDNTDARSRLDHIDDAASSTPIVQFAYDLGNRVTTRTYRNGTSGAYAYNANDWITMLQHSRNATSIAGFNYAYDNEGNKQFENKLHDTTRSEAYRYDSTNRLIEYEVGTLVGSTVPAPVTQIAYDLDPVGNWNRKTTDGLTQNRVHNSTNELTRIDSTDFTYDANGNLQNDRQYSYAYDEENRLIASTRLSDSATVGQYQYDALGRRVQKIAGATTQYLYDDARIVEEQDGSGVTQATYVYGNYVDEILTMDRGGQTYYYHQNALWSVGAITDASGTPVERYRYDAYGSVSVTDGSGNSVSPNNQGTPHSAIGNPWMFTGRQLDEETGLYYFRARFYDTGRGRFLQRDPAANLDGTDFYPYRHNKRAVVSNLYEHAGDRPTRAVDPFGDVPKDCTKNITPKKVIVRSGDQDSKWTNLDYYRIKELALNNTPGTFKDVSNAINRQLLGDCDCIQNLVLVAHSNKDWFEIRGRRYYMDGKTRKLETWETNGLNAVTEGDDPKKFTRLDADNAAGFVDVIREGACFCKPCTIWLLGCHVGLGGIPPKLVEASGCTVQAPKGEVFANADNPAASEIRKSKDFDGSERGFATFRPPR